MTKITEKSNAMQAGTSMAFFRCGDVIPVNTNKYIYIYFGLVDACAAFFARDRTDKSKTQPSRKYV